MKRQRFAANIAVWTATFVSFSCTTASTELNVVTPPACTQISSFGNGQACAKNDTTLTVCGTSATRTCASGWLCFDSATYPDCSCTQDSDCAGRLAYINAAREQNALAPIVSKCSEGRCSGLP